MFRNIYFDNRKNKIHLWETINGERTYSEIDWVPYVYVPSLQGDTLSIFGDPCARRDFRNYWEYKDFCKKNTRIFENEVKPEIQYLCERYAGVPDDDIEKPDLAIQFLDIEVHSEEGFPAPEQAKHLVTAISVYDSMLNKTYTFGIKPYTGKLLEEDWFHYFHCEDEKKLLLKFLHFVNKTQPDVITGWNTQNFDMPYLVNRIKRLWGEDKAKDVLALFSPIGIFNDWIRNEKHNIDIAGVALIDYLPLYKKFSKTLLGINLESYKLDRVANFELEKGKLAYDEYDDLKQLFHQNWNLYIEYNVVDVKRVKQIEDKRKFIDFVLTLSLLAKCPMKFHDAVTALIEGLFLTYYRRNNLCAPYFAGGVKEPYEAAYVKEPHRGYHTWVVDLDIVSSYPHAMITMNMGNETYFGNIMNFLVSEYSVEQATEEQVIKCIRNNEFPPFEMEKADKTLVQIKDDKLKKFNLALSKGLFCISPNGTIFWTNRKGCIAEVERYVFEKRKETKGKMKDAYNYANEIEDKTSDEFLERYNQGDRYKAQQIGYKLLINSIYGALAVPYFRCFNTHIAEAICACGRYSIKRGEYFGNELMNDYTLYEPYKDLVEELQRRQAELD